MKNTEYVVAFIFDHAGGVWMIEKQKPEWQKGFFNGIGGKVEPGETPKEAIYREVKEEAGVRLISLTECGTMEGTNNDSNGFKVTIFTGRTGQKLTSQEAEQVHLLPVLQVLTGMWKTVENVPAIIALCDYKLNGHSHFDKFKLIY